MDFNIIFSYFIMGGSELVAVLAVLGSVLTGLTTACFHGSSMSRCKTINCLCFKCDREVLQDESIYHAAEPVAPRLVQE